jgi:redox-sensitive bicupin YhaK (pirin superfamily)
MIKIRKANERGHFDFGWLNTYHTFSFGEYYDPSNMGFSDLRVINDDVVHAGGGFPPHGHRDMEIITYVLSGALRHQDSMGNGSVIRPGDVQRMSAGTGVRHSEKNESADEAVHLLQIWIMPAQDGIEPGYEQKNFSDEEKRDRLRLIAAPDGADGAVTIHQDARLYAGVLDQGVEVKHEFENRRVGWLHVARGGVTLNGQSLGAGDGVAITDEAAIAITGTEPAEVLLFDLAA